MLPFRLIEAPDQNHPVPLYVYCVGQHDQRYQSRPNGFPADQVFISRRGRGIFRFLEHHDVILEPNTALVIPAGLKHEYLPLSAEAWELGYVGFQGVLAADILRHLDFHVPVPLPLHSINRLWEQNAALWHMSSIHDRTMLWDVSASLYSFLLILREQTMLSQQPTIDVSGISANDALTKAAKLMQEHYSEPLLMSNVARAVGYSIQHFDRLFLRNYGSTPNEYLKRIRMHSAAQLLQENQNTTVQEIAQRVGLETNYFIRIFKKTYGETPKVFQKSYWDERF